MQSGRENTLEERYAIKFCFKNVTETYGMLQTDFGPCCMNRASFFEWHKTFKNAGSLWGMMRGVGVRKLIYQSWLAKGLGLGLGFLCWGFKGVQEEIPSEEASTLQIWSVAFPPGECTSPQLHPCRRLFNQDGHQTLPHLPYRPCLAPCDFWLFPKLRGCCYETTEETKEAVTKVIDMLTSEDFHGIFQMLLERYNKFIAARRDYFEGDLSFMCVLSIKIPIRKSLETYLMILVFVFTKGGR